MSTDNNIKGGFSILNQGKMLIIPDFLPVFPNPMIGIAPFVRPTNVIFPSVSNGFLKGRQYFNTNDDPELRSSVVNHFYKKLQNVWLSTSMAKLLKYVKIDGNNAVIVSSVQELEKNTPVNSADQEKRTSYILDRVFSKYDLEALLTKLATEYMLNWYDMKNTHNDLIKRTIYRKIKHRLSRHL